MVKIMKGIHSLDFSETGDHSMELWILDCPEGVVLIDTGMGDQVIKMIEEELDSIEKEWTDIKQVLITHKHGDHINNLAKVKELTGAPITAQAEEAPLIKEITGIQVEGLAHGESLPYCGGIEVIHVPGHSEGNSCYYLPNKKVVIAGDTVFGDEDCNLTAPPERYCLDVHRATIEINRILDYDFDVLLYTHGKDIMENARDAIQELVDKTRNIS
jgi:glyoxylase-like metal-dependent hydrolase (beta-lactamase superfamily II)